MDEERQAMIGQMIEITNCNEELAINYLNRTNYNIEIAVRHFFEGTMPEPITSDLIPSVSTASSSVASSTPSSDNSTPDRSGAVLPRYHYIIQFLAQFLTLPVRFPLIVINYVYTYFFGTSTHEYTHIFDYISKEFPQYDGQKKSIFYKHQLQSLRNDLPTKHWKWLVTYVHDPKGNLDFFHSLFSSNFSEQVRSRGGVFFGCVMGSEDSQRLRPDRTFGRNRKSCIIIFVIKGGSSLTRKLLIEDLSNPEAVNTNVDMALIDLIADEADRLARNREQNEARRLMEEQNREYQESLKRDLERIAKNKLQEEAARKAQQEEERKQKEAQERLNRVETYKKNLLQNTTSEGTNDLLIRFPSGKKVIKFNGDDKIEKLFDEAMRSELCPLFFQMHQSFPKKAIPCLPQWYFDILSLEDLEPKEECLSQNLTFQETGITHGSMVYIDIL